MKPFNASLARLALIVGVLLMATMPLSAQTTIDNTTLSAAVTTSATSVTVASVTCTSCTIGSNTVIYVDMEAMCVTGAYRSGTTLPVTRGCLGTRVGAHNITNGVGGNTVVFIGPGNRFHSAALSGTPSGDPPTGACTRASQQFMPWVNINNGYVWTCDGYNWRATVAVNVNGTALSRATQ